MAEKNDLERLMDWLAKFPGADILGQLKVDYTDQVPTTGAVFPSGLVEIRRRENILGDVTVENQYNFALYCQFEKSSGDEIAALANATWIMDFQRWVQEQSVRHQAPTFGNIDPAREVMRAQNGTLYDSDADGTVATYMIILSAQFKSFYKEGQ